MDTGCCGFAWKERKWEYKLGDEHDRFITSRDAESPGPTNNRPIQRQHSAPCVLRRLTLEGGVFGGAGHQHVYRDSVIYRAARSSRARYLRRPAMLVRCLMRPVVCFEGMTAGSRTAAAVAKLTRRLIQLCYLFCSLCSRGAAGDDSR
uniref:Uncharacterized protein n=1 Tax=Plectus sambesii TaxID=2011161 RepID=A0A914V8S8_9BILA